MGARVQGVPVYANLNYSRVAMCENIPMIIKGNDHNFATSSVFWFH